MARVQELMMGLDSPRPLPIELRERIEASLVFTTVKVTEDNLAAIIDRPKALPASLRARIEALFIRRRRAGLGFDSTRMWQALGAAAVAAAVLIATLIALPSHPGKTPRAIPPFKTVGPEATTPAPKTTPVPKRTPVVEGTHFTKPTQPRRVKRTTITTIAIGNTDNGQFALGGPATGTTARRSTASRPVSNGESVGLLDSVTSLLSRLLATLQGPQTKGSSGQIPVDDTSLVGSLLQIVAPAPTPANPAPKPAAPRKKSASRARTTKVNTPKTTKPAPAAPISIPLISSLTDTVGKTVSAVLPAVGSIL